jgi:type IV pilus assembly protein PilQ
VEGNTQSLIIRDTAEGLERIKKLVQLLDVQTPQIVIDAKVIDATESFTKAIEGKLAFGTADQSKSVNFNGGSLAGITTPLTLTGGTNAVKFGVSSSSLLNALLTYSEGDSKAKVISSPRVLVLSGKSATINQTSNIAITQTVATVGSTTTATTFVPVPTTLTVTPRATNEGSVFMNLNFTRAIVQTDSSGQASPATRNITTDVIVDSGNTLVLGGVQSVSETEASSGVPFLRKIPLIGWLFGKETLGREKSELMFFVTPRILNMKRAGMGESASSAEAEKKSNI